MSTDFKNILIIGINGGLAQITAKILASKYSNLKIIGIDNRPVDHLEPIENCEFRQIRYTRNEFERLFRAIKFDAVFHLGRMSHAHLNPRASLAQRLDLNVMGTNRILELSTQFGVKKIIVLSTWHVYGAYPDNPVFIGENSLLKASIKYPDLRDVVEMDQLATNWMWKYQHEIETIVFRPCSIIGPKIKNSMTSYLTTPFAPLAIDFNPMMQFIHEFDMANILCHSLNNISTGVYNIATDETISLHQAKDILGVKTIPVSVFLLERLARFINKTMWSVPDYLIEYLKYPCIISNDEIKNHLPNDFFRFSIKDSLELIRLP